MVLDGSQELDRLQELGEAAPSLGAKGQFCSPLPIHLRDLPPGELELLELLLEHRTVLEFLDHYLGSDIDGLQGLLNLKKRGLLAIR